MGRLQDHSPSFAEPGLTLRRLRLRLHVSDLADDALGLQHGQDIWIDATAAGHGWFVDSSPSDDLEFAVLVSDPDDDRPRRWWERWSRWQH